MLGTAYLKPLRDVRRIAEGQFEAMGADPQMLWSLSREQRVQLAKFRSLKVEIAFEALQGHLVDPCLYLDWGDGFSQETRRALSSSDRLSAIISSNAGGLRQIRFDPSSAPCEFKLLSILIEPVESHLQAPPRLSLPRRWARRILRKAPVCIQNVAKRARRFILSDAAHRTHVLGHLMGHLRAGWSVWRANYENSFAIARQWRSPEFAAPPLGPPSRDTIGPRVVAFYLPQYHPIPENDAWWGTGFTEWTNVSKAVPQFEGHHQPRLPADLGYYDLRLAEARRAQAQLASLYGVDAFCFHYYWFAGRRLLERPLDAFVADEALSMPFALSWANENWTRRWDGAENDVLIGQNHSPEDDLAVFDDLARYLNSPRYLRVGGKPLLTIYRPDALPDPASTTARWRARAIELGIGEVFLACTNAFGFSAYRQAGFDALIEFPPHAISCGEITEQVPLLNGQFQGRVYDYTVVAAQKISELADRTDPRYLPGVMPGWDNEARKPGAGHVFHRAGPQPFADWMDAALKTSRRLADPGERLVFVNAWNEWAEGAYLEPDRWFGHAYGQAIRAALEADAPKITPLAPQLVLRSSAAPRHRAVALVHLHYAELIEEFASALGPLGRLVDLSVTFSELWSPIEVDRLIHAFPTARLAPVPNRGRDILPFLTSLAWARPHYDVFIKLHSKRSPHLADGDQRRSQLLSPLTDPALAERAINRFAADPKLGMLATRAAQATLGDHAVLVNNRATLDTLARHLAFTYDGDTRFAAGSMFWGRVSAFDRLLKAEPVPFERELARIDGGLAHAYERAFAAIVASAGFEVEFDL
jgi:lipopolysaccharide biosynthesis protein